MPHRHVRVYRTFGGVLAGIAMVAAALVAAPAASAAPSATRYVSSGGDDTSDCTETSNPCETIAYAIDRADPGDIISIGPGDYTDSTAISKSVHLVGHGQTGSDRTLISNGPHIAALWFSASGAGLEASISNIALSGGGGIIAENADITLSQTTITGSGTAIEADTSTVSITDSTIRNNAGDGVYAGNDSTVSITDSTITDNAVVGVFADEGSTVSITNSTITENAVGVIAGEGSTVSITGSTISENAGVGVEAPFKTAHVGIENSTVSDNAHGGLVIGATLQKFDHVTVSGNHGIGLDMGGTSSMASGAVITSSVFDSNTVAGAVISPQKDVTIAVRDSTFSNTTPSSDGSAGPVGVGAGIIAKNGTADISDSTFYGNAGQGLLVLAHGSAAISHSTLAGTSPAPAKGDAPFGAMVHADLVINEDGTLGEPSVAGHGDVTLASSIIAGGTDVPSCAGSLPVTDSGYNLASDDSCALSASTSKVGDPVLGSLADNGGTTRTALPGTHSPAIDAIPFGEAGCAANSSDQRGVSRPQPGPDGACDIGAVELKQDAIVISPSSLPHATAGEDYRAELSATGGLDDDYTFTLAPGSSLPPNLTLSSDGVISGVPTAAGSFTFTVSVNDPVLQKYTLVVDAAADTGTGDQPSTTAGITSTPATTDASLAATGTPVAPEGRWALVFLAAGLLLMLGSVLRRRVSVKRRS